MLRTEYDGFPKEGQFLIKVGVANSVGKRLPNIQCGCPFRLDIHCGAKSFSAEEHEKILHDKLERFKIRGEWFLVDESTFDYVEKYIAQCMIDFRIQSKK